MKIEKEKSLKREIAENSFWEFVAKIIEKTGALVLTIILTRFLLPEGFGIYSLTLSISLVFLTIINDPIDRTFIRYTSYALGKNKKTLAAGYFRYFLKVKLIFSLIIFFLLLILSYPLSIFIFKKPFLFPPLFASSFYIFFLSLESFYQSMFYILKKVKVKTIKEGLKQITRILIISAVFFIVSKTYSVLGVIIGLILTSIIIFIFLFFYTRKSAVFLFSKEKEKIDTERIKKFCFYLFVGGMSGIILSYADILILGIFLKNMNYIGFYSASSALVWGLIGALSFATVFLPIFTQIKKKKLEHVFNEIIKYSFLITIPAAFGVAVLSKHIIFFIYGKEYLGASIILSLMAFLIAEGVNGGALIGGLFLAREKPKSVAKILFFVLMLNIALNFIFIFIFLNISEFLVLVGVAVATLISRYVYFISLIVTMKRELEIRLLTANWIKPLISSLIMAGVLFLLNSFVIKDMTLVAGLLEIVLGIIIYFLVMVLIKGISKKDINLLKFANKEK